MGTGRHMARGIAFATLGAVCWGFSATCIQLLTSGWGVSTEWAVAVRLAIAGPVFLVIALATSRKQLTRALRTPRSLAHIAVFGLVGILATQLTYFYCTIWTNAGTATTLERLSLLVILGYTCIRARRAPLAREIAGIALAFAGVVVIATQGDLSTLSLPIEGLLWGFATAACMAGYVLIPVKPLADYGAFAVTGIGMTFAAVVFNIIVRPWTIDVNVTGDVVWVMALMIIIGTVGAYAFFMQGVNDCGPVPAGMLACVEPVSAIIISAVWLHTPVSMWDIIGCALIIAMVLIVTKTTNEA